MLVVLKCSYSFFFCAIGIENFSAYLNLFPLVSEHRNKYWPEMLMDTIL
jgi:hypothetical protein